jgi:hypothetical protein
MNNLYIINEAISAHKNWISKFQHGLTENFVEIDLDVVRSDKCCILGKWLHSDDAEVLLSEENTKSLIAVHATFHEVAYLCALMLNCEQISGEYKDLVKGLDNLSDQIVSLLEVAKQRLKSSS